MKTVRGFKPPTVELVDLIDKSVVVNINGKLKRDLDLMCSSFGWVVKANDKELVEAKRLVAENEYSNGKFVVVSLYNPDIMSRLGKSRVILLDSYDSDNADFCIIQPTEDQNQKELDDYLAACFSGVYSWFTTITGGDLDDLMT